MSVLLVVLAVVIAAACVLTVAGMTSMGLAGGDGEPVNWVAGVLAAVVGLGSIYNVMASFAAFWGLDGWRWWPMWAAPVAGLVGIAIFNDDDESGLGERLLGIGMQLAVALPAALLMLSGRVSI